MGAKTAENLCLGFSCWRKGFFAKVSGDDYSEPLVCTGGKGLDVFRDEMLGDTRLRQIHDFPNAADCFPGIEIKGGVNYFLWDRDDRGDCLIRNYEGGVCTSESVRPLREDGMNTLVRYNNAISILRKVTTKKEKKFSELVSSQKPFGLRTFVKGKNNPFPNSIKLYRNNGVGYIEQDDIAQGSEWLDKAYRTKKVLFPRTNSLLDKIGATHHQKQRNNP